MSAFEKDPKVLALQTNESVETQWAAARRIVAWHLYLEAECTSVEVIKGKWKYWRDFSEEDKAAWEKKTKDRRGNHGAGSPGSPIPFMGPMAQ